MLDSEKEKILSLLGKEWELKGPPGILDVGDVVSILSLAPSDSMETIRELFLKYRFSFIKISSKCKK